MLSVVCFVLFTLTFSFAEVKRLNVTAKQSFYHDNESFTQGLYVHDTFIWESSGGFGKSFIRKWDLASGENLRQIQVAPQYFIEGITRCRDRNFALTWKSGQVFEFSDDLGTLSPIWKIEGEGWGISCYQNELLVSNGSSNIQKFDPNNGKKTGEFSLSTMGLEVKDLNELEVVGDFLLVNQWYQTKIFIVDLKKKQIIETWDFAQELNTISPYEKSQMDSMNGIAWDAVHKKLYFTGKKWFQIYEIQIPRESVLSKISK